MGPHHQASAPRSESRDSEREALDALDAGDRKRALTVLMEAHGTAIYRYCRHLVSDPELAEDAHQMTFVQAYEALERFSRRSTLRTWLFSIARHRCLDAAKIARRRRARFEAVAEVPEHPAEEPDAEDRLEAESRRRALEACLGELEAKVRGAIFLRFQQDLSYPEMSEIAGERPATLQARVVRALPVLRRCLEAKGAAA